MGADISGIFQKAAGVSISEDILCQSVPRKRNTDRIRAVISEYTGVWRNSVLKTYGFGRLSGLGCGKGCWRLAILDSGV